MGVFGLAMTQAVIRRPLTAEARVWSLPVHMMFRVDKLAVGQVIFRSCRFSPVNIIPPLLHNYIIRNTSIVRETSGWNLETIEQNCAVLDTGQSGTENYCHLVHLSNDWARWFIWYDMIYIYDWYMIWYIYGMIYIRYMIYKVWYVYDIWYIY